MSVPKLHDGRYTPKTHLSLDGDIDYVEILKEELQADHELHVSLMEACEETIGLLDLIDQEGFWLN